MSYHTREEDGKLIHSGADLVFCGRTRSDELIAHLEAECQVTYADWKGSNSVEYYRQMEAVEQGKVQLGV